MLHVNEGAWFFDGAQVSVTFLPAGKRAGPDAGTAAAAAKAGSAAQADRAGGAGRAEPSGRDDRGAREGDRRGDDRHGGKRSRERSREGHREREGNRGQDRTHRDPERGRDEERGRAGSDGAERDAKRARLDEHAANGAGRAAGQEAAAAAENPPGVLLEVRKEGKVLGSLSLGLDNIADKVVFGRAPTCDVVVEHLSCSRAHAQACPPHPFSFCRLCGRKELSMLAACQSRLHQAAGQTMPATVGWVCDWQMPFCVVQSMTSPVAVGVPAADRGHSRQLVPYGPGHLAWHQPRRRLDPAQGGAAAGQGGSVQARGVLARVQGGVLQCVLTEGLVVVHACKDGGCILCMPFL
jgi:hypothetical protein